MGSNRCCSEPLSSTSRSPSIDLPQTSRKIGTHPTIREDTVAPPTTAVAPPLAPAPPAIAPEEIIEEEAPVEMVPEQEAPVAHEVIMADAEPKQPQPCLLNMIMRVYEESLPRMVNGPHELDDLDDPTEAD
jgi:hypothetical protein